MGRLFLGKDIGQDFQLIRVRLVHGDMLPRVRKRLGLGLSVSEIKKTIPGWDFFESAPAFAVVQQRGRYEEVERECLRIVREELSILALSQLGYRRRKQMGPIVAAGEISYPYAAYLAIDSTTQDRAGNMFKRTVPFAYSVLDGSWKRHQDAVFFTRLLKTLRGETKVECPWYWTLRRASVRVGESVGANDLFKSFLWNMVALEMILTTDENKGEMLEILPQRVGALLDWSAYWSAENYKQRIKDTYVKRNDLLHRGRRDELTAQDVAFMDYLLNVLTNVVSHPKLFSSKQALVEFCQKVEAERTLGRKPRVRPKTLRFIRPVEPDF